MAREKRIQNWERLFAKVTTAKSHGRRWKFNIEAIKEKAKLGLDHIQVCISWLFETLLLVLTIYKYV